MATQLTGVDRDAEMAAAAAERGVPVIQADVRDVSGEYDVVLFTRSLHHADDLDDILAHAVTLLAPGGRVIIEEFAWERVDQTAADFLYDNRALLVATGLLDAETPPMTCSTPGSPATTSSTEAPPCSMPSAARDPI
jgi:SAM-dependent methyltransferase